MQSSTNERFAVRIESCNSTRKEKRGKVAKVKESEKEDMLNNFFIPSWSDV